MSDVNGRLAEILAEYAATITDIERPTPPSPPDDVGRCLLRPADQQRAYRPPKLGPTV